MWTFLLNQQCYHPLLLAMASIPNQDSGALSWSKRSEDRTWKLLHPLLWEQCGSFPLCPQAERRRQHSQYPWKWAGQSMFLSTESNAAFKSTNVTRISCWNSLWIFVNRCNAKIASSVERQRVNQDWWGRRCFWSRGSSLAKRTCANTLPGTDKRVIGLLLRSDRDPFP